MTQVQWLLAVATGLAAGLPAWAKEVRMAVPRSVPPYVIAENWSGIEYDVVKQSLAKEGHVLVPHLTVLARLPKELQSDEIDAAMTMKPETGVAACYSDSHVTYRNYAISLERNGLEVNSVADLAGKTVVAFQNARIYLGAGYAGAVQGSAFYREEANQVVQALLLYSGRMQIVVADVNIFRWFAAQPEVTAKVDTSLKLRLHAIFPPTDYHVAFHDPALCADFNRGLRKLRDSGEYDRIVAAYLAPAAARPGQNPP